MLPNDRTFNGKSSYVDEMGRTCYRYLELPNCRRIQLHIKFIAVNSPYEQAVAFHLSSKPSFKGTMAINGEQLPITKKKHMVYLLNEGVFPDNKVTVEFECKEGVVYIGNASNYINDYPGLVEKIHELTGKSIEELRSKGFQNGFYAANLYGFAFWIEKLSESCMRFHCNDHKMDDDFDDLIFDLEIEKLSD